MIPKLRFRSFGDKIALAVTLTTGVAVLTVALLLALVDHADLRRETVATLTSQATMVSLNSGPAFAFSDPIHGQEALGALRAVPEVAAAVLHDLGGGQFASYRRAVDPAPVPGFSPPGQRKDGRWLLLTLPVQDRGEDLGRVTLVYDLSGVRGRLRSGLVMALLVTLGTVLLVNSVAQRIQKGLAAPIDELVKAATQVSQTRDFSLRATRTTDDELGQLTEAFNEMLSQIQQQEQDLHSSHAQRGALLESERAARAEAERASRMKDDFVATLSHELRTPLMPILGWVELVRLSGEGGPQTQQALEVIERNARLQTQMIDDLLDISRIVSGKLRLDVQPVDLSQVIEAAVATVRPAAEAREIRLQVVLDPRAGPVRGDPDRLQQVVWNLLSNAIKFTGKGGRVQVSLARINSHVEIVVSDTGKGIAADFLPHVFDRFRQEDSSFARSHSGLGLGLAIARQLVELHGGSMRAESPGPHLGATFSVSLPLMPIHAEDDTVEPREHPRVSRGRTVDDEPPSLAGLRLAVVDDDRDARDLLGRLLEQFGAKVMLASSAAEALQIVRSGPLDVLISDIGMPATDGYELMRQVRALGLDAGRLPAIALTAFARTEDRTRALRAGYQMHIAKPVEPAELITSVASLAPHPRPEPSPGS